MSAGSRIRTGEPLREEILSLSPLTRLGNSGLRPIKPQHDIKTIAAQGSVRTSPLGPSMYTVCSDCVTQPPLTSFRTA